MLISIEVLSEAAETQLSVLLEKPLKMAAVSKAGGRGRLRQVGEESEASGGG